MSFLRKQHIAYGEMWNKVARMRNLSHAKSYEIFKYNEEYMPFISLAKKANKENAKVLDVGCGRGRAMKIFNNIVGVDASSSLLKSNISKKKVVLADICSGLPFLEKTFDYSIACNVIGHLDKSDQIKALKEMARVTKKEILFNLYYLWTPRNIIWKLRNYLSMLRGKYLPIFGRQSTFGETKAMLKSMKFNGQIYRIRNFLFVRIKLNSNYDY